MRKLTTLPEHRRLPVAWSWHCYRLENGELRTVQAIVPEFIDPKRPAPVIARIVAAQSEPHDLPEGMMGKDRGANMNRLCGEADPWLRPDESRAYESESLTLRGSSLLALKTTHTTGEARIRIAELERQLQRSEEMETIIVTFALLWLAGLVIKFD